MDSQKPETILPLLFRPTGPETWETCGTYRQLTFAIKVQILLVFPPHPELRSEPFTPSRATAVVTLRIGSDRLFLTLDREIAEADTLPIYQHAQNVAARLLISYLRDMT